MGMLLREARERRGLSQSQLARDINIDQASISRAESGVPVGKGTANLLSQFFEGEVSTLDLIYGKAGVPAAPPAPSGEAA